MPLRPGNAGADTAGAPRGEARIRLAKSSALQSLPPHGLNRNQIWSAILYPELPSRTSNQHVACIHDRG